MKNRVIDKLIAEKVMGWREGTYSYGSWFPSTDINDAWKVLELFDFASVDRVTGYGEHYDVMLSVAETDGTYNDVTVKAETAPMAICLAALKKMWIEGSKVQSKLISQYEKALFDTYVDGMTMEEILKEADKWGKEKDKTEYL